MTFTKPLHFKPNIRSEKADATTGYTWGKSAKDSNILSMLKEEEKMALQLSEVDIVAERWMVTDDRMFPSIVRHRESENGKIGETAFFELLEQYPEDLLGPEHIKEFGSYLNVIMKQLDTNSLPNKGSLSVQLHPKVGHPTRPAKPEMWKGFGKTYLGWNKDMTETEIREAIEKSELEKYLNAIEMIPEKLIVVSGGLIHAIRYDTFTAEWSKAPGEDDIKKGNVKDATVSPYDRTDGKTPRPGKEDVENSLEVMRHANTFAKKTEADLIKAKQLITEHEGGAQWQLFRTPEVFVDEYSVGGEMVIDLSNRGLPVFIESGSAFVIHEGEIIDEISSGEEIFLPYSLQSVTLQRRGHQPCVCQVWYAPLQAEQATI